MSIWDDEMVTGDEFRDMPDETQLDESGQQMQSSPVRVQVQPQQRQAPPQQPNQVQFNGATSKFEEPLQEIEELVEGLDDEDDFSEAFNDANLRIEQGRLYQMIINHDLFEGMDADPRAVKNVQREIRKFARERMEIMLGMRQEQAPTVAMVSSPFNDLEVDILKKLASKATNGATETAEANQVAAAVRDVPKRQTLNSIGGSTGLKHTNAKPAKPQARPQQALPTKPQAPIKRTARQAVIEQIAAEEGVSVEDLELSYKGIGKSLHELTAEELNQRQKESAARLAKRKTVKSPDAIPPVSLEQEQMLAVSRATQMHGVSGMSGLKIPGGFAAILDKVSKMPVKT